jgi:hypothetical protein
MSDYILAILTHFFIDIILAAACIIIGLNFGEKGATLAEVCMNQIWIPAILLGMYLTSYFWNIIWGPVIIYVILRSITLTELEKRMKKDEDMRKRKNSQQYINIVPPATSNPVQGDTACN